MLVPAQHLAAARHTRGQGLNGSLHRLAQGLRGLVLQVGAVDEVLLNALLKHEPPMIPAHRVTHGVGQGRMCTSVSRGIEGRLQPFQRGRVALPFDQHHVEPARRRHGQAQQEMPGREHDAPLLDTAHAGGGTAMLA